MLPHRPPDGLVELHKIRELLGVYVLEDVCDGDDPVFVDPDGVVAVLLDVGVASSTFFASTAWPYLRRPSEPASPSGSCGQSMRMS